jgi:hypothetical protein
VSLTRQEMRYKRKSFRGDILGDISTILKTFYVFSSTYVFKVARLEGYPIRKSFRSDILRGYLVTTTFVLMHLGGKLIFRPIYHLLTC